MTNKLAGLLVLSCVVAAPTAEAQGSSSQIFSYEMLVESPSSWGKKHTVRFSMRYLGLKDCEATFAPLNRNGSSHVQLKEPFFAGGKKFPMFVSKKKGTVLRQLRETQRGVTYVFYARVRFFKTPVYTAESLAKTKLNVNWKTKRRQTRGIRKYYNPGRTEGSATAGLDTSESTAGYETHYVLDIQRFRKLKNFEKAQIKGASKDEPKPADDYKKVDPGNLAKMVAGMKPPSPGAAVPSIPVKFQIPYLGVMGSLLSQPAFKQLASAVAAPKVSAVGENNLESSDPASQLQLISPPGPLSKILVIAYPKGADYSEALASMKPGQAMELRGTIQQAPDGVDAKVIFYVESLTKVESAGGPPKPPFGGGGPPGPPKGGPFGK